METRIGQEPVPQLIRMWLGLLLPPLAWAAQLQTLYALQSWLCVRGGGLALPNAISLLAAMSASAGGWLAWHALRVLRAEPAYRSAQTRSRAQFMAALGVGLSSVFLTAIVASWIPHYFLSPCPL
jgi:hypothetical protein